MSVALTDTIDLARAAASRLHLDQRVSLAQLPRLVEALSAGQDAGETPVACDLEIVPVETDGIAIRGRIRARWQLVCQRCLGEYDDDVELAVDWRSGELPEGDFELDGEPVRLIEWVEDELLLAIPAIPKHADRDDCAEVATRYLAQEANDGPPMRTPFADLKNLLNEQDN